MTQFKSSQTIILIMSGVRSVGDSNITQNA